MASFKAHKQDPQDDEILDIKLEDVSWEHGGCSLQISKFHEHQPNNQLQATNTHDIIYLEESTPP